MLKVQKSPSLDFLESYGKQAKRSYHIKAKFCVDIRSLVLILDASLGEIVWKIVCKTLASRCITRLY